MGRCINCIHFDVCDSDRHKAEEWYNDCSDFLNDSDVVLKNTEGAECPTCHGTGRIGTTDWLIKNISKKQLAEEKARAIAEHERHIKTEYAREIFEELEKYFYNNEHKTGVLLYCNFFNIKKKYMEEQNDAD